MATQSRSEREIKLKDRAGWVITVLAAFLAINTYIASGNSSKILNNTIKANDTWSFYQAKSIKQTIIEAQLENAKEPKKIRELAAKVERYESDPKTGEGKQELMIEARKLEAESSELRKRNPWLTFAGSSFQISIVLLTASILAVSTPLFWGSIIVGSISLLLMSQGLWLWIPFLL